MTEASEDTAGPEPTAQLEKPTRMLKAEQQGGYILAAALVAAALASWLPDAVQGDGPAAARAAVGVGLALVLAAAVRYGQRVITSFTAVIGGFAPFQKNYLGVQFAGLLYGGWLMWRTSRAQQKAAAAGIRPAPRQRKRRGEDRAMNESAPDGSRRPAANRRYTPPKSKGPAGRRP